VERLRQTNQPLGAVGQPPLVVEEDANAFRDANGGNGQVVLPQPEREQPNQRRHDPRSDGCARHSYEERLIQAHCLGDIVSEHAARTRRGDHGRSIGPDGEETSYAEIQEPGIAPLHIQPQAEDTIDASHDGEGR
jgi:hypothetical protein